MQVDETKTKPKSLWRHLYQQVEEQSDFCDVTVQVQSWRRKFHWCVLMASPVLAKLHESKLEEQQTGLIKISIGNYNSVQTAIHFLYGKLPKITLDNVEDLLEVAEFLMIEELKAICISKLKTSRMNEDNCLKVLMLASRYDFYLEELSNFIYANLPDLLKKDEMLLLDKKSVRFILTDQLLAYVSREDCFRFLIKWVGHCEKRKPDFVQLFTCLDKEDLDAEVLRTVDLDCLSENDKPLCRNFSGGSNRWCDMLAVYPPTCISGKYYLCVYNLKKKLWSKIPMEGTDYCSGDVRTCLIRPNTLINCKSRDRKIGFYNLATQNEIEKRIEMTGSAEASVIKHVIVSGDKIYCVGNFVYTPGSRRKWAPSKQASRLYVSANVNDSTITMRELISICGSVQSACEADGAICLLIPDCKHIIVYSDEEFLVTKLDLLDYQLDGNSYICPCVKGGIYVVTKLHVLQLSIHVTYSDITVCVSDILVQAEDETSDRWDQKNPPLYDILQDKIITITRCGGIREYQYSYQSLPEKIGLLDKEEKFEIDIPEQLKHNYYSNLHFLQITLPKETVRCPIDCPHCKYRTTTRARYSSYDGDYYEPDYDSDCVYYADSDDYYPYDGDSDNYYYGNAYDDSSYYYDSD